MKRKINFNKILFSALVTNIFQLVAIFIFLIFSTVRYHGWRLDYEYILIYVLMLTIFVNSFNSIRTALSFMRSSARYDMLKSSIEQVEHLNNTLRGQRHDFMNHLQVVYSLIEMDEYKDAGEYISKVFNDIQKVSRILKTSNPAINALLQAKLLDAEKRGIEAELHVTSQLRELQIPDWELCRVLGNLIDNALDALTGLQGDRNLQIDIFEDLKYYGFKVINNGPGIPVELIGRIFEAGITTKGDKGHGMGLAIVKEILDEHHGSINVISDGKQTVFEGKIPR